MKRTLLLLLWGVVSACGADDAALVRAQGTVLLQDEFDRRETNPAKDDIGNGWTTNSEGRAKGKKQVSLANGVMKVVRVPEANHGVAIFHDVAFENGAVEVKFRLQPEEELIVDLVDRELKTVHAGHLCNAHISLQKLSLTDTKTGGADLEIQARREKGDKSPELAKLLRSKTVTFPLQLKAGEWHRLLLVVQGDVLRATLDDQPMGQLQSPGVAHPTKRMLTLGVDKAAEVDSVQVWKLP